MARDHALAATVEPGSAVLRLYRWAGPTLSFGRNEPARGRFDATGLRGAGVDVVRRPTGGRAVLHHRELTYSVALPVRALGGVREAYRRVNEALLRGLASLGAAAEIAPERPGSRVAGPDAGPCFEEPAPGELTAAGRKLVGSAQARVGRALLQHGSILVGDDQGLIEELAAEPGLRASRRPATLEEILGRRPGWGELEEAVIRGFRETLDGRWGGGEPTLDAEEEERWRRRYASDEWTWRR